jgi:DNA-binding transcriptional MerR regulator
VKHASFFANRKAPSGVESVGGRYQLMTEKLFYKIGEVSKITGLESYVLRFWESEFPALHPKKSSGKQRVYTRKEIDLVLEIKRLLYVEGLTIAGAKKKLSHPSRKESPVVPLRPPGSGLTSTIHTVKRELEELLHILS